jgi:threonine dehydratase
MSVAAADIRQAAGLIVGEVVRTPTLPAARLSHQYGCDIRLKLENLQLSGSFKARGALVRLSALTPAQRRLGVVAMSAGNHAQGVALHAGRMRIPATIVMPRQTPFTKVARTEALGATVVLHGASLSDAANHAQHLVAETGALLIHPYDDEAVIAGQGTVGLEMLEDWPDMETIVIPVGGGGLAAGIATIARSINPKIRLVGVQCEAYPSMAMALRGETATGQGETLAEGIAVKMPGKITTEILKRHGMDIILVGEELLEQAVELLAESTKIVAEGAGAASLAAVMSDPARFGGTKVGLVISGGNIDSRLLSSVLLRGLARSGRIANIRIELDDSPGALAAVASLIGKGGGNILEIHHRRLFYDIPIKHAEIDVLAETTDKGHLRAILDALDAAGYRTRLLAGTAAGR